MLACCTQDIMPAPSSVYLRSCVCQPARAQIAQGRSDGHISLLFSVRHCCAISSEGVSPRRPSACSLRNSCSAWNRPEACSVSMRQKACQVLVWHGYLVCHMACELNQGYLHKACAAADWPGDVAGLTHNCAECIVENLSNGFYFPLLIIES